MSSQYPYSGYQPPRRVGNQPSSRPQPVPPPRVTYPQSSSMVTAGVQGGGQPPATPPTPPVAERTPEPPPVPSHTTQGSGGSKGPGWGALIAAMVGTAAVSVGLTMGLSLGPSATEGNAQPVASQSEDRTPVFTGEIPDWEAVAAAVEPATVTISVSSGESGGTGSGAIIDPSGVIVTNNHVVATVANGGEISVTLSDGRVYPAELVGTDPTTDLAVIRLLEEPQGLVAVNLASSESLRVGEPVMAIGAPLGLSGTVTTGVISALDRPVAVSGDGEGTEPVITNAIQVDAAINQGNSGGPLFDRTGAVIGINSSIASLSNSAETAGSIGLGFAIPVDLVKSVTQQILETGTVKHALLGVTIGSGIAQFEGASQVGAVVGEVNPGSAAEEAGLRPGDVIIGLDGHPVVSGPSLTGYVRRYVAGDQVTLDVVRDGVKQQVPVVLQEK